MRTGEQLGPYQVLEKLGQGGMGEVYKGFDTRLERPVAIKFALADFDERFMGEAKMVAQLKHPHICTLYDIGPNYLVMEFVDGRPLMGPLPLDEVVRLGAQIGEALETAHKQGITHRDLKPGNILVDKHGVKLLDFGLAKREKPKATEYDITITQPLTQTGALIGTLPFMAPELLEGKEADARSDIWAFGAVLYEMVTGNRAFTGATQVSIMAAIIDQEPRPVSEIVPATPPGVERIIRRCLRKKADERWQSAMDIAIELREAAKEPPPVAAVQAAAAPAPQRSWSWMAGAAVLGVLAGGLGMWLAQPKSKPNLLHASITPPEGRFQFGNTAGGTALSPDGSSIAFVTATARGMQLSLRRLDSPEVRFLHRAENMQHPFWSPDGKMLGFFASSNLMAVDIASGAVRTLGTSGRLVRGATWNRDGVILFTPGTGAGGVLHRVSINGGDDKPMTTLRQEETGHYWPWFLPDGRRFLLEVRFKKADQHGIFLCSLDRPDERVRLLNAAHHPHYVPARQGSGGYLLWQREDGGLMAQPLDLDAKRLVGDAKLIVAEVERVPSTGRTHVTVSQTGLLVFRRPEAASVRMVWLERSGKESGVVPAPAGLLSVSNPRLSPDGKSVAFGAASTKEINIWAVQFERGSQTRLSFGSGLETFPVWSPDGRQIAYYSAGADGRAVRRKDLLSGKDELVAAERILVTDWSPDGAFVIGHTLEADLQLISMKGPKHEVKTLLATPYRESEAQFSPDGRWFAYQSDEGGIEQVFVQPFPPSGGRFQVSPVGGRSPRWNRNGKELFYVSTEGKLMAVPVTIKSGSFEAGVPQLLFTASLPGAGSFYDVSPDGKRILMVAVPEGPGEPLTLVQNWDVVMQ